MASTQNQTPRPQETPIKFIILPLRLPQTLAHALRDRTMEQSDLKAIFFWMAKAYDEIDPQSLIIVTRADQRNATLYDVRASTKLSELCAKIEEKEGIAVNAQKIVFQGREIEVEREGAKWLGALGIKNDAVLRLSGPSKAKAVVKMENLEA